MGSGGSSGRYKTHAEREAEEQKRRERIRKKVAAREEKREEKRRRQAQKDEFLMEYRLRRGNDEAWWRKIFAWWEEKRAWAKEKKRIKASERNRIYGEGYHLSDRVDQKLAKGKTD